IKLYVTRRCLELRRERPDLLLHGSYLPLRATGGRSKHVCAFARVSEDGAVAITVAPVLVGGLTRGGHGVLGPEAWAGTRLAIPDRLGHRFRNCFTGELVELEGRLPVGQA